MERFSFFKRRQIFALDILDERELDDLRIVDIADDDGEVGVERAISAESEDLRCQAWVWMDGGWRSLRVNSRIHERTSRLTDPSG